MQDLLQTGKSTAAKVREHFQAAIALLEEVATLAGDMDGDTADQIHSVIADLEDEIDDLQETLNHTTDALMEVVELED